MGEFLIDLIFNTFDDNTLNALDAGLADRFHEVFAGCRVRLSPALPTVAAQKTIQFIGSVVGLSPSTVTWSLISDSLGSTIDPQTGLFTAGQSFGTVDVKATSVADPTRFRTTTVTILDKCPAGAQAALFDDQPRFGPSAVDDDAPICIAVDPPTASLTTGHTQQFTATVTGGTNQLVVWSVTGNNTITSNGLVTAGPTAGTFTIRAASVVDPTVFGEATLTIVATSGNVLSGTINVTVTQAVADQTVDATLTAFVQVSAERNAPLHVVAAAGSGSADPDGLRIPPLRPDFRAQR